MRKESDPPKDVQETMANVVTPTAGRTRSGVMGARPTFWSLVVASAVVLWSASPVSAADPSVYRGFHLGMTVSEVAAAAALSPTEVKTVYQRPLLIQELEWNPSVVLGAAGLTGERDSVARVLFGFCGGELYRIVVSYDGDKTEGLNEQDLIDALSAGYGQAAKPVSQIITSPAAQGFIDTEDVVARWEDASASVNLFARAYRSTFGLVIFSKRLAPLARAGIVEGSRLGELDAPARAIADQKLRDDTERALHDKARVANKAAFRY
jgi:hypothetical protein